MMKPKAVNPHEGGMLEYLEDIIGTDRYVPQIEAGAKRCVAAAASKSLVSILSDTVTPVHGTYALYIKNCLPPRSVKLELISL